MGRAFAEIAFTDSVKAAQSRYGSRGMNEGYSEAVDRQDQLTELEREFISLRDGFFQATVSQSGWPYVQYRGGPQGFLKVLSERLIGFADFRGNVQYVSIGNINNDGRIALILMDYAHRRRLKLWGRARVVDIETERALVESLVIPAYGARVERGIVIAVEAFDWNCPRHITPRFTEAEIVEVTQPLQAELAHLRASVREREDGVDLGSGELQLTVTGARILTPHVRAYELRMADGQPLPEIEAGAYLPVPVSFDRASGATRNYSITSDPDDPLRWEIAVELNEEGSGGSSFIHKNYRCGTTLRCSLPRNGFSLHDDHRPTVLIAGGIGIFPLKAMAHALQRDQRWFVLHYAAASSAEAPYHRELQHEFPDNLHTYWSCRGQEARMDLATVVKNAPADSVIYVCGPARMIAEMQAVAIRLGLRDGQVCFERFFAPIQLPTDRPFEVRLERSSASLLVPVGKSLLDVLIESGRTPSYDCKTGTCGTCAVRVLQGEPDHRDLVLTAAERTRSRMMCTCVSRCLGNSLVLDM